MVTSLSNDLWTLDLKTLGFEHLAEELAEAILFADPPFAICVSGRWGSGKTSIMRHAMLQLGGDLGSVPVEHGLGTHAEGAFGGAELKEGIRGSALVRLSDEAGFVSLALNNKLPEGLHPRITTVWFSPWRYQKDPDPLVPLLHAIRREFSAWAKAKKNLSKYSRVTIATALETLGHLSDAALSMTGVKSVAFGKLPQALSRNLDEANAAALSASTATERFNLLFEHAVGQLLGVTRTEESSPAEEPRHRLVVFIDDLDRCEGESAVRMLEAIKLYLSTRYCVFVLGVDPTAIQHALKSQWDKRPHGLASEYLDKLFQTVLHVPQSDRYPGFIEQLLKDADVPQAGQGAEKAREETSELLARIAEPRPRKVKNLVNGLIAAWRVAVRRGGLKPGDLSDFALLHRIREQAPGTHALLRQRGGGERFLDFLQSHLAWGDEAAPSKLISGSQERVFAREFGHVCSNEAETLAIDELDLRIDRFEADRALLDTYMERKFDPWQLHRLIGRRATPAAGSSTPLPPADATTAEDPSP